MAREIHLLWNTPYISLDSYTLVTLQFWICSVCVGTGNFHTMQSKLMRANKHKVKLVNIIYVCIVYTYSLYMWRVVNWNQTVIGSRRINAAICKIVVFYRVQSIDTQTHTHTHMHAHSTVCLIMFLSCTVLGTFLLLHGTVSRVANLENVTWKLLQFSYF